MEMRPCDFWAVVRAYQSADNDRLIFLGELIRGHAVRIMGMFANRKITEPSQIWKMPWDESQKKKIEYDVNSISDEERHRQVEELMKKLK